MNRLTLLILSSLMQILTVAGQANPEKSDVLKGPYLGQLPPGNKSEVFAPDFVSTDFGELNSVFTKDGSEFYFSRRGVPGKPSTIMVTKMTNNVWSDPEPVDFSGIYSDIDLFITAGGDSMVFCSTRPVIKGGEEKSQHDFWISKRVGDKWTEPELFAEEALSEWEDFFPVITNSGNLYFNSQRGGQKGNDIFCSKFADGKYLSAERLPEPINSEYWEFDANVSPDEKIVIFSSVRPGGFGGADIYICFKNPDGSWSPPKNLGQDVNSSYSEYGSTISPDGKYFFYTSNKNGSEDIFWVSADVIAQATVQNQTGQQEDPNAAIFMNYFKQNWDDIHDVIMRFHNDNPQLKGVVLINMNWQQGRLADASVESNDTGDPAFSLALIEAMKRWQISGLADGWASTLPIRTAIYGSNDPAFNDCGIFTGNIADSLGKPLNGARVILIPPEGFNIKPDTVYSNREGIFICTLIQPGEYQVECIKKGYVPAKINKLKIEKGKHIKRSVIMKEATVQHIL